MLKEIKNKVKEKATDAKDFVIENKSLIIAGSVLAAGTIGCVIYGKHTSKKYETAWRKAKDQLDSKNITDFGPYKIAKFFEPSGEFIGEIPMHEKSTKAFLELK